LLFSNENCGSFLQILQTVYKMQRVTLVVMSEFGRWAQENGGLGTDHGHGNMMMVMGGGCEVGDFVTTDGRDLGREGKNLAI